MNETNLSKRLTRVSEFVPKNSRLADIGSDHAYLPTAMMLQGKLVFAVAGEVVQGPYESAKKQVKKNGLEERIQVRLANGLQAIDKSDNINVITICGMGGVLIRDILQAGWDSGCLTEAQRLILQPNVGEKVVRHWLMVHGYTIIAEDIIEEHKKIYEIIVAMRLAESAAYTEQQCVFGPVLLTEQPPVFLKKWHHELKQKERILAQLKTTTGLHEEKRRQIEKELSQIKEVLTDAS